MKPAARLALYGAGLVVAFGAAYGLASVIVPASFVADWVASGEAHDPEQTADEN
ncbi:hypothetical protein [Leucobacter aridicollis]|uniref:Uncharacterized protein n=1 Tax=Leucobacter aridicollis TaxID=283878 RepID=A0A852RH82_9MICO|nr:hypothetical protein [Leucobacter aridicollis]NYD27564.1 hypothetical protein [Leucobacter aridicollis]